MVSPITILPLDFSPEDAYITGGKFATKHVPVNLRRLVVAESASNDGLAYPFLTISLYLSTESYRSAFRDWSAECTGYAHEVCEMALAHVIGNKSEAAYRRGDMFEKRRRLMADWADYCAQPVATAGSVVPIRKGERA